MAIGHPDNGWGGFGIRGDDACYGTSTSCRSSPGTTVELQRDFRSGHSRRFGHHGDFRSIPVNGSSRRSNCRFRGRPASARRGAAWVSLSCRIGPLMAAAPPLSSGPPEQRWRGNASRCEKPANLPFMPTDLGQGGPVVLRQRRIRRPPQPSMEFPVVWISTASRKQPSCRREDQLLPLPEYPNRVDELRHRRRPGLYGVRQASPHCRTPPSISPSLIASASAAARR